MGRKRRVRIQRKRWIAPIGCPGKKTYTIEVARGTARAARNRKDRRLKPYFCRECGGWHLTSGEETA